MKNSNTLAARTYESNQTPDYEKMIVEIIRRYKNKNLLKRVYDLASYLYLYEDGK